MTVQQGPSKGGPGRGYKWTGQPSASGAPWTLRPIYIYVGQATLFCLEDSVLQPAPPPSWFPSSLGPPNLRTPYHVQGKDSLFFQVVKKSFSLAFTKLVAWFIKITTLKAVADGDAVNVTYDLVIVNLG